ncbi:hypothetical protein D2Q93_13485 [Alicyclobacillaceae bacterium I2511]|nr:hypothetical protein D2Q93_13485 [Alicyclobacillaceae bacterium I2511]
MPEAQRPHKPSLLCLSIIGLHNAGKTTLAQALIQDWVRRGLKVAVVKRDGHATSFHRNDWEKQGSDTQLLSQAGATLTLLVGADHSLLHTHADPDTGDVLALCRRLWQHSQQLGGNLDAIVVEGFKHGPLPKLAVVSSKQEWIGLQQAGIHNLRAVFLRAPRGLCDEDWLVGWTGPVYHIDNLTELWEQALTWQTTWNWV